MSGWAAVGVGAVLAGGYALAWWARPASLPRWSGARTAAWLAGVVAVVVALSPPLTDLAHHDHRFHMATHLLLGMYAPLGLVLGAPVTLALGSLPRRGRRVLTGVLRSPPVHVLSHPVPAAVLNVGGMVVLYLTPLYGLSMARPEVHALVMAHFLLAGCLYTWAIAGPDPAPRRPGMATRTTVLVAAAGAHAFLAKLLYARAGEVAAGHGDPASMEAGAQWMYYGGDVAELALAVMLFAWWYRRRRPEVAPRASAAPTPGVPASSP
ncbi:cytochrome c oxidase assembly protein [Georgenia faecalis]|uniref:cytochrome c oxidase assembly protein n=1 Tax=Georgenia faecalis TaxID=2483799 RepID=UPI000FDA1459|nr:cytochrome c oxidase assembly protein [Georgenia faecalis]